MLAYASFTAGFLANAAVNGLVLAPLSIWGYFHWKSRKQHLEKNLTDTQKSSLALVLIGGTLIVYTFTAGAGGALPLLDALTSVIPIIATYLMAHAYRQQWWMWIPYNFLQALMWFSAASLQPAVLAVFALKMVFLVNSLIGYYNWKQKS
jgi:nicotinamide mononucleotide transporter PnuC